MSFLTRPIQKCFLLASLFIFSSLLLLSSTFVFHPLSGIDSQPARKFISPKIAVHLHPGDKNQPYEGSICVIWTENTAGNGDVNDNITSFGSTRNLGAYLGKSSAAQIAVYQDNVYVE